jgi:hypothetical protein
MNPRRCVEFIEVRRILKNSCDSVLGVDPIEFLDRSIAASLDQDPLLCNKYLNTQFEGLLLQPLQRVGRDSLPSKGVVVMIDALDECDNSESIRTTLLLLSRVEAITSLRLRISVTSRPELPVELGFKDMSGDLHHDIRLEEAQEMSIAHDIHVFYKHEFAKIKKDRWMDHDELPAEWPREHDVQSLVNQAIPLFIFAFTVSRYIAEDPRGRLDLMLRQSLNKSLTGLKGTYLPILTQVGKMTNAKAGSLSLNVSLAHLFCYTTRFQLRHSLL